MALDIHKRYDEGVAQWVANYAEELHTKHCQTSSKVLV